MTRQHFEAIAATIANATVTKKARGIMAEDMADTLSRFNPNFDKKRFLTACHAAN